MRIPIRLSVRTEDGALHEQLTGSLYATRAHFARVDADVDFADLDGTLEYETDDAALRFVSPSLSAVLSRDGDAGAIGAGLERREGGGSSLTPLQPLLVWPAQSACGRNEIARPTTPDWAIPVENASLSVWRRPEALDGGSSASVEVALTGELCDAESGETTAPATVHVRYPPSDTDVTFPVRFARVDDRFELELTFYSQSAMVPHDARGVLSVVGFENNCMPMCTSTMCNGCPPLEPRVVFSVGLDGQL